MGIKERRPSVENPRAMDGTGRAALRADSIGTANVASYVFKKLKFNAQHGDRIAVSFGNHPEATRAAQFARLVESIRDDAWLVHALLEADDTSYRIVFANQIVVTFT